MQGGGENSLGQKIVEMEAQIKALEIGGVGQNAQKINEIEN